MIVYAFSKGWGINQLEVVKINKSGKDLFVEVDIALGIMEVMSGGIVVVEVKKTDITGAKKLNIVEI